MSTFPRDDLVRALRPGVKLRSSDDGGMPTLFGHFAVFNRWAEIDSMWEGHFLERFVPGAFKKTIRENRDQIKALFQHGHDPQVGDKPLGPIKELREDGAVGAYYEVPMLDTGYNREILPGLEEDLYGASFRFRVIKEELVEEPDATDENPRALPERTVKEARLYEFGPVTFPAYADATAGVRSMTDDFLWARLSRDPERLREFVGNMDESRTGIAVSRSVVGDDNVEDDEADVVATPGDDNDDVETDVVEETVVATPGDDNEALSQDAVTVTGDDDAEPVETTTPADEIDEEPVAVTVTGDGNDETTPESDESDARESREIRRPVGQVPLWLINDGSGNEPQRKWRELDLILFAHGK